MSEYWEEEVRPSPGFSDDNAIFRSEVSAVLTGVREELDDHRQAINETTNEIESNVEWMTQTSRRIDLLSEQIEQLSIQVNGQCKGPVVFKVSRLTHKEKLVFSSLYACTEENPEVTYRLLGLRLSMSDDVIAGYITNLMEKGIPVKKRMVSSIVKLSLDRRFRTEQAKQNLVGLDQPLTAWI